MTSALPRRCEWVRPHTVALVTARPYPLVPGVSAATVCEAWLVAAKMSGCRPTCPGLWTRQQRALAEAKAGAPAAATVVDGALNTYGEAGVNVSGRAAGARWGALL